MYFFKIIVYFVYFTILLFSKSQNELICTFLVRAMGDSWRRPQWWRYPNQRLNISAAMPLEFFSPQTAFNSKVLCISFKHECITINKNMMFF